MGVPGTIRTVVVEGGGRRRPTNVVRFDMLLFLMIPLSLLAFTVAIGPVLAMTLIEHHRAQNHGPARASADPGDPAATTATVEDDRNLVTV